MLLLSILCAVIVSTALGMLWYSPLMFGHAWMQLSGVKMGKNKDMMKPLVGNILTNFVTALMVFTLLLLGFSMTDLFAIWSAFALPILANAVFWEGIPLKLFLINAGFSIVSLALVASVIIWVTGLLP